MMLIPAYVSRKSKIQVLISQHSDGEYIARVIKRLGFGVIRGSTTRGGMRAIKALVDKIREGILWQLPLTDRRPSFCCSAWKYLSRQKNSVALLFQWWSDYPVIGRFPVGISSVSPNRFSRALMLYGDPIHIPPTLNDEDMERYRLLLEQTMIRMAERADILVRQ